MKHLTVGSLLAPTLPIETDERDRPLVDAFIARNRAALDAALKEANRQVEAGESIDCSIDEIIAEGRKRNA